MWLLLIDLSGEVIVSRLGEEDKRQEDSMTFILISSEPLCSVGIRNKNPALSIHDEYGIAGSFYVWTALVLL